MRWIVRLIFGFAVGAPLALRAEPLLTFGPDIPLFITVSASVREDSNVNLTPVDAKSDTIFVLAPGTDFHYTSRQLNVGLTFSEQFIRYASKTDSELNGNLADLVGNATYTGSETSFSAAGSYVQENQSTLSIQSINQTIQQTVSTAGLNGTWDITAKTKFGLGADYSATTYPETGFDNSQNWNFPVNLYYAVTPKLDLSVGYARERTTTVTGVGDSAQNFFNVGGHGDFTPKLTGDVTIGISELLPEQGGTGRQSDLGLNTALTYQLTPKATLGLTGSSGFTVSPLGTTEKSLTLALNGNLALSEAWNVNGGVSYNLTQYISEPERTDHFYTGNVGVSYIWTQATSFSVSYLYRRDDSNLAIAGFDDNVFSFTAASRF